MSSSAGTLATTSDRGVQIGRRPAATIGAQFGPSAIRGALDGHSVRGQALASTAML